MKAATKLVAVGVLLEAPTLRHTLGGLAFCKFPLGVEGRPRLNVRVWGMRAESCAKFLKEGSRVVIEGELSETGETVIADHIQFLPIRRDQ